MKRRHVVKTVGLVAALLSAALFGGCDPDSKEGGLRVSENYVWFNPGETHTESVSVSGAAEWSAVVDQESEGWLTVTADEANIYMTPCENFGSMVRKALITVTAGDGSTQTVTVEQGASEAEYDMQFDEGYSCYFGDLAAVGTGLHSLVFKMGDAEFIDAANGYAVEEGIQMIVGMAASYAKTGSDVRIAPGEYPVNDYMDYTAENTLFPGANAQGSMVQYYSAGVLTDIKYVVGGSMKVSCAGTGCMFVFDFELSDGTVFTARCEGDFAVYHLVTNTTLAEDIEAAGLAVGGLSFVGEEYMAGLNYWSMVLLADGLDVGDAGFTGSGDILMLEFLTPLSVTEGIPSGTYPVSFEDRESVAMAGFVYRNLFMGCFYMGIENGAIGNVAAVVSGTVTVERDGETYAVALDGADMAGNRITAAFRGAVEVSDERDTGFLESAVLRGRASAAEAVRASAYGRMAGYCMPADR